MFKLALLLVFVASSSLAQAEDVVTLQHKKLKGDVLSSDDDNVILRMYQTITIPRSKVISIEHKDSSKADSPKADESTKTNTPATEPKPAVTERPTDTKALSAANMEALVDSRIVLCRAKGLIQARLKLDPDNAEMTEAVSKLSAIIKAAEDHIKAAEAQQPAEVKSESKKE